MQPKAVEVPEERKVNNTMCDLTGEAAV